MAVTPNLTGSDGKPLTWVDPTNITVAVATMNYPEDKGSPPLFTNSLPQEFFPLLDAAEKTWELDANIKFINVPDAPSKGQSADIRVGMASLWEPTKGTIGLTNRN